MDDRDRLAFYPFVVVRIACRVCSRNGAYRLARLAAKFGPEIGLRDLPSNGFPTTACGGRRRVTSGAFQPAASTCRTLSSLGRPTCRPGSCGCVSWSATIDGWPRIEAKDAYMCNLYSETKGQAAIRALFRAAQDRIGNLPVFPGIFPDQMAPIVRNGADSERELVIAVVHGFELAAVNRDNGSSEQT